MVGSGSPVALHSITVLRSFSTAFSVGLSRIRGYPDGTVHTPQHQASKCLRPSACPSCLSSSRSDGFDFLDTWQGWTRYLTSLKHSKPDPRAAQGLETPTWSSSSYLATLRSSLLTLASTQHGNTLRIKNTGSTSWKPLRSSLGHARDDDDEASNEFITYETRKTW